jgi:hypothetical protein
MVHEDKGIDPQEDGKDREAVQEAGTGPGKGGGPIVTGGMIRRGGDDTLLEDVEIGFIQETFGGEEEAIEIGVSAFQNAGDGATPTDVVGEHPGQHGGDGNGGEEHPPGCPAGHPGEGLDLPTDEEAGGSGKEADEKEAEGGVCSPPAAVGGLEFFFEDLLFDHGGGFGVQFTVFSLQFSGW